jgi:hypothetical protein
MTCVTGLSLTLGNYSCMGITSAALDGWGLNMRSNIMQFAIRMIVAFGIAVVGVIAISDVVAYSSSAERAWVIKQETLTSPSRIAGRKGRVSAERISAAQWPFLPETTTSVTGLPSRPPCTAFTPDTELVGLFAPVGDAVNGCCRPVGRRAPPHPARRASGCQSRRSLSFHSDPGNCESLLLFSAPRHRRWDPHRTLFP